MSKSILRLDLRRVQKQSSGDGISGKAKHVADRKVDGETES